MNCELIAFISLPSVSSLQEGIYVSDVNENSIANLYLKRMDKILDVDGTDFTRMGLNEARQFFAESHSQNAALNVMISRK